MDAPCTDLLVQNHSNFKRSAAPARFMYYSAGSWLDFPADVANSLRLGFERRSPAVEVVVDGDTYLFDFYRMVQVRLDGGDLRSVAWIDINGRCFFPKQFFGTGPSPEPEAHVEVRVREGSGSIRAKRKREEETCSNDVADRAAKKVAADHEAESSRWPRTRVLKEGEKAFEAMKNMFLLSGIRSIDPGARVTSIHKVVRTGVLDSARLEVFQRQIECTKVARGGGGIEKPVFAWHGTSAEGVEGILRYGFSVARDVSSVGGHGVGVYLSPVKSAHTSAMLSKADDNGEKHVILCRVILGSCEKVEAGSRQMYPCSMSFDNGVDDFKNPKWYVVWGSNMNSHILPECVVSYQPSKHVLVPGQLRGSAVVKSLPNSYVLFPKLLSKLGSTLPSSRVPEFQTLCSEYKDGRLARDYFVKQLRSMVGDEMLVSAFREVRG